MIRKYVWLISLGITGILVAPFAMDRRPEPSEEEMRRAVELEAARRFERLQARFAGPWPDFEHRPLELTLLRELALEHPDHELAQEMYLQGLNYVLLYAVATKHTAAAERLEPEFWEHAGGLPRRETIAWLEATRDREAIRYATEWSGCQEVVDRVARLTARGAAFPESHRIFRHTLIGLQRAIGTGACSRDPTRSRELWREWLALLYTHADDSEAAPLLGPLLERHHQRALQNDDAGASADFLYLLGNLGRRHPHVYGVHNERAQAALDRWGDSAAIVRAAVADMVRAGPDERLTVDRIADAIARSADPAR